MPVTPDDARRALLESLTEIAPESDPATLAGDVALRDQLDLDSFDFLRLMVRLHERLGVDVPERDYGRLQTIDGAVGYLAERGGR
jgi:acyl carrier protein